MSLFSNLLSTLFGSRNPDDLMRERYGVWASWLQPLAEGEGVGRDPGYEDAFFTVKDEVAKLGGINDALIVRSCEQLLKETAKDLRVAGYYTFARLRQHGTAGFVDGLELTAELVECFGQTLLPARAEAKRGALEWLATSRMLDLVGRGTEFAPADLERAMAALNLLITRTAQWPEAARPNLQPLVSRFEADPEPVQSSKSVAANAAPPSESTKSYAEVSSSRDLLEQARQMAQFLRKQEYGYLASTRLIRCVRWDTVYELPPSDAQGRTRLIAPRFELRQQLRRLASQKLWPELLERVESIFTEGANHLWFDLQYFQNLALDHVGTPYLEWGNLIRSDFVLLLERLTDIERLTFSDGTPFADSTTIDWIANSIKSRKLQNDEPVRSMPQIADESDSGSWIEIESKARELLIAQGLDAAYAWLAALPNIQTDRQQFLQRWLMARLADQAGKSDTAQYLLSELNETTRQVGLSRWEPALTFEVKQHLLRVLRSGAIRKDADMPTLNRRIEQLQSELIVLDPARAVSIPSSAA